MDDLISRQMAIEGKMNLLVRCDDDKLRFKDVVPVEYLQNMPSAEPEDKCSECDAWNKYKNYSSVEPEFATDCISRQVAIDGFYEMASDMNHLCTVSDYVSFLESLPSAESVRMKGKWCVTPDGRLVCSRCYETPTNRIIVDGNLIYDMTPIRKLMKFCPNCGASMSEGEEE